MGKSTNVGGQAVLEGVMMRGKNGIATAVRKTNEEIVVNKENYTPYTKKSFFFSLPIIRGFVSLIESLVIGIQTLNYSASFFEEQVEESKFDKWFNRTFKDKADNILIGITLLISFIISAVVFFIFPTFIANFFKKIYIQSTLLLNIIEGIIRITIFLLYILLISNMEDIKRVFQYHGAEHKTIFCYENHMDLIPENAIKFTRFHPRCGTNFLFLVMIVSILLFSLTGWNNIWQRILYRIILLPVVSGVTYEIIKWLGKSNSNFAKIIAYPGLMLQKLTTKEPDLKQLEVAIMALKAAEGIENSME
ncbi:DUF1385 domain-containing protein [Clostridium botulinum]|uniref:DUF1385 domain-containing protein n=1 Tax=Clostridium botulinum TaxID=1491 RepID=A0A846J4U9_CLOBO|nr:DUF1385 domain-containing protein [Clostridium botulinum]ACA56121.1 conserved hypothetical protein [Clostridium botulinum A3 str. Loch Maree]NFH64597.1 DUF1385 domain-containing protein [Clostridium botulinum]NFJ08332.1 DUF1385 domain-containing protein [Clostridium botulinum]NFK16818.1 DUF1385 domain-containing protein [Clostridium botulinum]NFM94176.1 DUF1385 domain-containing protein [Clostridium botulinum]